jgi:hypothetical protein
MRTGASGPSKAVLPIVVASKSGLIMISTPFAYRQRASTAPESVGAKGRRGRSREGF